MLKDKNFNLVLLILVLISIFVLLGFRPVPVLADSLEDEKFVTSDGDILSFEDLSSRKFDNGTIEYYYDPPRTWSLLRSQSEGLGSIDSFDSNPYWVFYKGTVYSSPEPFKIRRNSDAKHYLITPESEFGLNVEFYSYMFGMFKTGSSYIVYLDGMVSSNINNYVKSNHDILLIGDSVNSGDVIVPAVSKDYEPDRSEARPLVEFNYYQFKNFSDMIVHLDDSTGLYTLRSSTTFGVSYFDSSQISFGSNSHCSRNVSHPSGFQYGCALGYIDDAQILRHYVISNYNVPYPGGFLSVLDPSLMPSGWKPTYDKILLPGDIEGGGNEGGGGDEEGSIFDYINPFSDKFFLLIAFVPDEDFFVNELEGVVSSTEGFLDSYGHIFSSLEQIFSTKFGTEEFDGIDYGDRYLRAGSYVISVPGAGSIAPSSCKNAELVESGLLGNYYRCTSFLFDLSDFKLLDASYISGFISKFRYWVSSVMQFFFLVFIVRWLLSLFGYHGPNGGYSPGSNDAQWEKQKNWL